MAQGGVYTSQNQIFVFNGIPMSLSRAEGTFVVLSWLRPQRTTTHMGVDGLGMHNRSENRAATIDLTILANGIENDILSTALLAHEQAPNGLLYPLMVQQGGTLYTGLGVIVGPPPVTMGDAALTNVWQFSSTAMVGKHGSLPPTPVAS
jgi:hypothetical protein